MRRLTRDEAIASANEEHIAGGCLMCAITRAAKPFCVVARAPNATVIIPRLALARGHLLVIADAHLTRFGEMPRATWEEMMRLAWWAARSVERTLRPARCYVASLGSTSEDLPMTSPHLHVHVVPVANPDARPGTVLTWDQGVLALDDGDREALRLELLAAWDDGD